MEEPSDVPSTDAPTEKPDVEAPTDVPVAETPTEKPDAYQAPIGENLVVNAGFEDHGELNKGHWGFMESITGWQASSGNIQIHDGTNWGKDYPGPEGGTACLEQMHLVEKTLMPLSFRISEQVLRAPSSCLSLSLPVKVVLEETMLRLTILLKSIGEAKKSLP